MSTVDTIPSGADPTPVFLDVGMYARVKDDVWRAWCAREGRGEYTPPPVQVIESIVGDTVQLSYPFQVWGIDDVYPVPSPDLAQEMTNSSTLPSLSTEERKLLEAGDALRMVLDDEGLDFDECHTYIEAAAAFMATRKEE